MKKVSKMIQLGFPSLMVKLQPVLPAKNYKWHQLLKKSLHEGLNRRKAFLKNKDNGIFSRIYGLPLVLSSVALNYRKDRHYLYWFLLTDLE